jgi:D-alanyl-D-alanine carboxypeptidase
MSWHVVRNRLLQRPFQMRPSAEGSSPVGARRIATLAVAGAVLVQCGPAPPPPATPQPAATSPPSVVDTSPPTTTPPPVTPATPIPTIQPVTFADLGPSWHPGCPIDPQQLRRVEVNYIGFDGMTHRGDLIVHEDLAAEVVAIFDQLLQLRYPIEKIRTVDNYPGADDELSMEDNNTSAYNCRDIPGTGRWSQHAYGRAIDLNPLLNPEIDATGAIQPTTAAPYLDRNRTDPGILHAGDAAVRVFTDRGWRWGGNWRTPIDYQHFER